MTQLNKNVNVKDIFNNLESVNLDLKKRTAIERIEFAFANLPGAYAMSSSFGALSAVSLHMLTQVYPNIPVLVADTGYLFPETYQFIDLLQDRLNLNLTVVSNDLSSAWQEARFGKQWEQGQESLNAYNQRNKVQPIEQGLHKLAVNTWFAGLRSDQSATRKDLPIIQNFKGRYKVHPIIDWTSKDLYTYLQKHDLPYHPLWEQGFVSIGDTHSTRSLVDVETEDDLRFAGFQRECGLHVE